MEKLKRNQIVKIARIHAAINLLSVDLYMFEKDSSVNEEDQCLILDEMRKIALKIAGKNPTNLGSTSSIVNYVCSNPNR